MNGANPLNANNFQLFFNILGGEIAKKDLAGKITAEVDVDLQSQSVKALNDLTSGKNTEIAQKMLQAMREKYGDETVDTLLTTNALHRVAGIAVNCRYSDLLKQDLQQGPESISNIFCIFTKMQSLMKQIQEQVEGFKNHWSKVMGPMISKVAQVTSEKISTDNIADRELQAIITNKSAIEKLLDQTIENIVKLPYIPVPKALASTDEKTPIAKSSKRHENLDEFDVARRFLETIDTLIKDFEKKVEEVKKQWTASLPSINRIKESLEFFGEGKIDLNFTDFATNLTNKVKAFIDVISDSIREPIAKLQDKSEEQVST